MWALRELVAVLWDGWLAGSEAFWRAADWRGRLAVWRRVVREGRRCL